MSSFQNGNRVAMVIIIIFLSPNYIFSQKTFLSLSALNDSADHYLPRLLEKRALVNSSSSYVTETRNQFLPSIRFNDQVNIGTDNSTAGSYFPYGIIPSTSSGVRAENDYQAVSGNLAVLYGEYDLVDFGYKNARINYAKSEQALSQSDLQREMYILHGRICRAYFNLMISEARMAVEKETVKRYDTIFNIIQALTVSGIKPGSDSSLAKAELSKSRITYNQINERAKNYREEISYLTGVAPDQILTDSVLMLIGKRKNIVQTATDTMVNPLIDYYANLSRVYLSNEQLLSKSYLPKISLTAASWARGSSIVYDDQYKPIPDGLGYQRFNYLAGISFQYDLFNGLHKKDRLKTFGFEREASELELKQQQISLASATRQAQNSIDITEKNLLELPIQYQSAVDTYNQKIAQYKAGIITLIDLTNAAFVLDRSLNDYAETTGNWYLAQLDKAIATGQLTGFIQSIQ
ncbi:MAG TPA: TolC family protein [Puia sp.]|jgi:outer membrane protein TolC